MPDKCLIKLVMKVGDLLTSTDVLKFICAKTLKLL